MPHEHDWWEVMVDDNDDRTRTEDLCFDCRSRRFGCFAKRLGEPSTDGDTRGAWGPVGVWTYKIMTLTELESERAARS